MFESFYIGFTQDEHILECEDMYATYEEWILNNPEIVSLNYAIAHDCHSSQDYDFEYDEENNIKF